MLLNRNGTIIANRDNHMIGESLFGNQFEQMKKDTNQRYVPFIIQDKDYLLHSGKIRRNGMIIVTAISKEEINQNLIKSHLPIFISGSTMSSHIRRYCLSCYIKRSKATRKTWNTYGLC